MQIVKPQSVEEEKKIGSTLLAVNKCFYPAASSEGQGINRDDSMRGCEVPE